MQFLLNFEVIQPDFLLLLKLSLFLSLTDVGLEVFELILSCSLAFLVVIHWLGNGFNWGVSDWDQNCFLVFVFFLAFDLLLFLGHLFFEFSDTYPIFYYFF